MIGLATDETSAMNEIKSGFGTLLQERFPSVRTIHRLEHRLQLAVKDVLKYVAGISNFKVLVRKLNYIVFAVSQKKEKKETRNHEERRKERRETLQEVAGWAYMVSLKQLKSKTVVKMC